MLIFSGVPSRKLTDPTTGRGYVSWTSIKKSSVDHLVQVQDIGRPNVSSKKSISRIHLISEAKKTSDERIS